jgi:hypothetical protein
MIGPNRCMMSESIFESIRTERHPYDLAVGCMGKPAGIDFSAVELSWINRNFKEVNVVEGVQEPRELGYIRNVGSSHSAGFQIDDEESGSLCTDIFKTCFLENGYGSIPNLFYLSVGERPVPSFFEPSVLHDKLQDITSGTKKTIRHCKALQLFYQGFLVNNEMYQYNSSI